MSFNTENDQEISGIYPSWKRVVAKLEGLAQNSSELRVSLKEAPGISKLAINRKIGIIQKEIDKARAHRKKLELYLFDLISAQSGQYPLGEVWGVDIWDGHKHNVEFWARYNYPVQLSTGAESFEMKWAADCLIAIRVPDLNSPTVEITGRVKDFPALLLPDRYSLRIMRPINQMDVDDLWVNWMPQVSDTAQYISLPDGYHERVIWTTNKESTDETQETSTDKTGILGRFVLPHTSV